MFQVFSSAEDPSELSVKLVIHHTFTAFQNNIIRKIIEDHRRKNYYYITANPSPAHMQDVRSLEFAVVANLKIELMIH